MSHEMQNRVIPVLLTAVIGMIGRYLSAKPRVVWGVSHQFAFNVGPRTEEATGIIYTRSLIVQNMGRAAARDINVIFNFKPNHYQLWPHQNYTTSDNPEKNHIILVPSLGKGNHFRIEMVSVFDLPIAMTVRDSGGDRKQVDLRQVQQFPSWVYRMILALMVLGIFSLIQNIFLIFHK